MPAPGWRIIFCYRPGHLENGKVVQDDHREILFEDMPVVGWGVVHVHDEDGEADHNEVELLTAHEDCGLVEPVSEVFRFVSGGIHHVLSPKSKTDQRTETGVVRRIEGAVAAGIEATETNCSGLNVASSFRSLAYIPPFGRSP